MIKAIIATMIAGTFVGFALLWLEYNYFIPALGSRSHEESPVRALARPCAPGSVFQDNLSDGSFGPFMVIIPTGQFQMGNILNLDDSDEQPVHWVSIDRFAIGRFEVSFAEYDRFAIATGIEPPDDQG